MLRGLIHYWRINLAVLLAAAVATAVLTGALLVGDSVRGSLRALTLERLGRIQHALTGERFFREELADSLADVQAVPAILVRGSAVQPESGARASRVAIHGIDGRFASLFAAAAGGESPFGPRREGQLFPPVVVNQSLARELDLAEGDSLILSLGTWSRVPRDTLMGQNAPEDVLSRLRVTVVRVLPDRGMGRFSLSPHQIVARNAFVPLDRLQRALDQAGSVNALLVAENPGDLDSRLERALTLEDRGLLFERGPDWVAVESQEFVIRPRIDEAIGQAAAAIGAPLLRIQSYVANQLSSGDRSLPYSLVAALESPGRGSASLELADGSPAPPLPADGVLVNTWAAEDLEVGPGDTIQVDYYAVGPREELIEQTRAFTVQGVVAMRGLGADRALVPDYPGLEDAEDIAAWDPPFPVDLSLIRDKDEDYWDDYGPTPKAFFAETAGRELWSSRYGSTTAVRVFAPPAADVAATEQRLRERLRELLTAESFGFRFQAVRAAGLEASAGATDFSEYFIYFSFFLIVAAALLVGLLFGLAVEQRAHEIGLLRAVGYPLRQVRLRFLAEGQTLAACGALLGVVIGIGYAALMMLGLRTLWLDAVGSTDLKLHITGLSLMAGWLLANLVVTLSIVGSVVRLGRVTPPRLLAGSFARARRGGARRRSLWIALVAGALGLGLFATAVLTRSESNVGLVFGAGASLLVAGLGAFSWWCRDPGGRRGRLRGPLIRLAMAARNTAWSPGRSLLSVALVAFAAFTIVAVAANHHSPGEELQRRDSGTGGYALLAEADIGVRRDLNRHESRLELGFTEEDSRSLEQASIVPLRVLPGDDASCLNLYRPEKPRVLGVPREMIARGGFEFRRTVTAPPATGNPWELLETEFESGVIPAFADANSAQWILHKKLGEDVELEDEFGQPLRLRLVGLLGSSVFQSELLISEDDLLAHFPSRTGYRFFLIDTPGDPAVAAQALERNLAPYGFDTVSAPARVAAFKAVENTYMSTFELLGGLGLLLGTVGLGVVLVRNVIERRGELATLRAFGYPRGGLARIVLAENLFLLLVGIAVGGGAALLAVAPRLATIHVDWTSLALTLVAILLVGMLAGTVAVRGALRTPLLPALKAEQ